MEIEMEQDQVKVLIVTAKFSAGLNLVHKQIYATNFQGYCI